MATRVLEIMPGGRIPLRIAGVHEVELLDFLDMGGFGSVWKVVDCGTGRLYALKIIQNIKPGSVMEARVRLEAEVAIPSDYIVPVMGLQQWNPSTFLILSQYFPGRSLDRLLSEGDLTVACRKRIFEQTLLGVADAHRSNIVHRDLKPGNILVNGEGNVGLIDFGISKFKDRGITITGEFMGTPPYMAPELIIKGARVADARSDIYALGQILYELAMGQSFWKRRGWRELADMLGYLSMIPPPTEVTDLSDFHCGFFPEADRVLVRMVKIDPGHRYSTVDEVLTELGYAPDLPPLPPDLHLRHPLLIVESGENRGARTLLSLEDGDRREMGRVDIAGNDESISRRHLEFHRSGERYFIRDRHSKNGTMLRGVALAPDGEPAEVRHADRIKVGDVFLRFAFMRES